MLGVSTAPQPINLVDQLKPKIKRNNETGDTEVPQPIINLVDQLKAKIKKNNEISSDFGAPFECLSADVDGQIKEIRQKVTVSSRRNRQGHQEVAALLQKSGQMLSNLRAVSRISEESRTNPLAGFNSLLGYLQQSAEELKDEIEEERKRIVAVETPLKEYLNVKEGVIVAKGVCKKELFEHLHRTQLITDDLLLKSESNHEYLGRLKQQHLDNLRRLYGRYVPSPFAEDEQEAQQFEYDPRQRTRGPNIFPSSVTLMNLAEGMPRAGQQQPVAGLGTGLGGFGGTQTSIFAPKPTLGAGLGTSTLGGASTGLSLFGGTSTASATPSLFGGTSGAPAANSPFGGTSTASATPSLFGGTSGAPAANSTFGGTSTASATPSLFGGTPGAPAAKSPFGGTSTASATSSLFGGTSGAPAAKSSFAGTTSTSSTGVLFGATSAALSTSLFGATPVKPANTSLFGAANTPATSTPLFGAKK